jgi:hypothetical protein
MAAQPNTQGKIGTRSNGNGANGATAPRPRVLRVGILLDGKLIEERIVRDRVAVTIGQSMKNMFSLPLDGLPLEFTMFAINDNKYSLRFLSNMDGRLSDGNQVNTLDAIKRSAQKEGEYWTVPVSDTARGKISFGELTLLFQFVSEPPKQPKPMLPASVRGTFADRIEPRVAMFLGGSIVLHMGIMLWAIATDREVGGGIAAKAYDLTFKDESFKVEVEPPAPEPTKTDGDTPKTPDKGVEAPKTPKKEPAGGDKKPATTPTDKPAGSGRATDDAVARQEEANAFANALTGGEDGSDDIGAMAGKRPGVDLGKELNEVKESGRTVSTGSGSGRTSRGNGDPRTGTGKGTGVGGPTGTTTVGDGKGEEKIPAGRIKVSDKQTFDESSLTPDAVLGKINSVYMAGLKACYKKYLVKDATARGKVQLTFEVSESGRVSTGKAKGFASEVDECISSQMSRWTFPKPVDKDGEGTSAGFSIGLQLVPE